MPLYKRPDSPKWWVSIGEDVRQSTGITHTPSNNPQEIEENRQLAIEFERVRSQEIWRVEKLGDRGAVSFGEAARQYLAQHAHEPEWGGREKRVLVWLMDTPKPDGPQLRERSVKDVGSWQALTALRGLGDSQGWDPNTVNRMLTVVSAVLHSNPEWFDGARVRIPLYRIKRRERPFIDAEQISALCQRLPWHLVLASQFAVLTLLRMRAMLSLRWCDVYPARRWAIVRAETQKTNKPFGFALTDAHLSILAELKKYQAAQYEEYRARTELKGRGVRQGGAKVRAKRQARLASWDRVHVFTWWGARIDDCNTKSFAVAVREAGCPAGFNWHSWRHTGATLARFAGLSLPDLQALGGWESIASVQRYAHIMPQALLPAASKLAAMLPSVEGIAAMRRLNAVGGLPAANGVGGYGAAGDRTPDLDIANVALSQLSYSPTDATIGAQTFHVGSRDMGRMDPETFKLINELVTAKATKTLALRRPGESSAETTKPKENSDLPKVADSPTGQRRPRKTAAGR